MFREVYNTSTCSRTPFSCGICRSDGRSFIFQTLVYNPNICRSSLWLHVIGQHKKRAKKLATRTPPNNRDELRCEGEAVPVLYYKTTTMLLIYTVNTWTPLYTTNTNNINKTWTLLQTTGDKDQPKIVLNRSSRNQNKNKSCELTSTKQQQQSLTP